MSNSITKLKSSIVGNNNLNISNEEEPAMIEGIYGTKGFYFQVQINNLISFFFSSFLLYCFII